MDETEYEFLTAPGACLSVQLAKDTRDQPEVQLFGNRAGLLSLANVLLWFLANAWRREFLSLAELPFVHVDSALAVFLRLTPDAETGQDGVLSRVDSSTQFEWTIPEDDLKRVACDVHRLVANPSHEYDRLRVHDGSAAGVHIRMTDVADWLPWCPPSEQSESLT